MTPQQQAIAAVLQKMGIPADKIDGAAIDALVQAVAAGQAPPAANADPNAPPANPPPAKNADGTPVTPPAKNADGTPCATPPAKNADPTNDPEKTPASVTTNAEDPTKDPAKMAAKFSEMVSKAVAAAVAPLQAELTTIKSQVGSANTQLAMERAAKDRAEVAAFVERNRDRLLPYELDEKVAKEKGTVTIIDQLLSLPTAQVATFAEGRVSPRAAAMRQIENRPSKLAQYAEKIPAPVNSTPDEERKAGLAASRLGQQVLAEREKAAKVTNADQMVAQFAEAVAAKLKA